MTVANDIIFLSLRNSGVTGVGQTPLPDDVNDAFTILNAWINEINLERMVKVNRVTLPVFPDLTTDVPFWTPYQHVLLTSMAVRLRQIYALPPVQLDVQLAASAMLAFNAINQQQVAPLFPGLVETVEQAIFLALRMAGRITDQQSVADNSKDVYDAFGLMMMMLAQWQRKRWLVWNEVETTMVSTGANFYTIGRGLDFNAPRPDKIHSAWVTLGPGSFGDDGVVLPEELPFPLGQQPVARTPNMVDIPLSIIEAREDWATIAIKDLKSIPAAVFYDSSFPTARLYFWPVPPANTYQMHVTTKAALPDYDALDNTLDMPPEYTDALVSNLACKIIVASGGQISPFLAGQARASLETIKMANSQIPLLSMPAALSGHRGGDVSSWSGRGLNQACGSLAAHRCLDRNIMAIPLTRLGAAPLSTSTGYPWQDGDVLYAADLNAAFLPVENGGTINGNVNVLGSIATPVLNAGSLTVDGNSNFEGAISANTINTGTLSVPGNAAITGTLSANILAAGTGEITNNLTVGGTVGVSGAITGASLSVSGAVQAGDGQLQMYELGTTHRVFAFSASWLWTWENATGNLAWNASGSGSYIEFQADPAAPAPINRGINWLGPWQGNGAYIATSDERTKTGIEPATEGLAEVLGIEPIRFRRDRSPKHVEIGFSAGQLASVLPEAVVDLGRDDMRGITSDTIVAALVNAVKTLSARIAALEDDGA